MRPRRWFGLFCVVCLLCFLCLQATPAPQPSVVRFAVIGDSGTGDKHQARIARQMLAWHDRLPYELVLMLGDNIYGAWWGGGNKKDFAKKFDQPYAELLKRGVTFRAALGNHDMRHRDGRDLIEAYERFHIEGPQGYYRFTAGEWFPSHKAGAPRLRSGQAKHLFRTEKSSAPGEEAPLAPPSAGLVEFFVLNTVRLEKNKHDPEQMAWLERALAESRARWRIVYGHHPMYSSGKRHSSDVALRKKLEPLLTGQHNPTGGAQGPALPRLRQPRVGEGLVPSRSASDQEPAVHVVLAGHDHIYQRFHPQKGVLYFVCGSSGKLRRGNARPSVWVAAGEDQQRAFMLWEATPEELRYRAINEQGQAFDCGTLTPARKLESTSCEAFASRPQTGMSAPPQ